MSHGQSTPGEKQSAGDCLLTTPELNLNVRHAVCLCRKCRALGKVRRSKVHWGPEFISLKGKGLWNVALEKEGEVVNLDPVDHYIFTSRSTITCKSVHLTKNTLVSENTIVWLLN